MENLVENRFGINHEYELPTSDVPTLNLDQSQAFRHLSAVLCGADPQQECFLFLAFHDAKDHRFGPRQFYGTIHKAWPMIQRWQRRGYGIFVCVNETRSRRRTKADIIGARAVIGDFDGPVCGDLPIASSLIVSTSPGKQQNWWFVDRSNPISLSECEQINRAIATRHGADRAAVDCSRVLRLAGTYHLKRAPHLVRIVSATDQPSASRRLVF